MRIKGSIQHFHTPDTSIIACFLSPRSKIRHFDTSLRHLSSTHHLDKKNSKIAQKIKCVVVTDLCRSYLSKWQIHVGVTDVDVRCGSDELVSKWQIVGLKPSDPCVELTRRSDGYVKVRVTRSKTIIFNNIIMKSGTLIYKHIEGKSISQPGSVGFFLKDSLQGYNVPRSPVLYLILYKADFEK